MVLSEDKRLLNLQIPLECFFFTTYTICKFVSERCDNIFFHLSHKYYWLLRERRESHLLLSFQRLPLLNAWEDVFVNFFCKYLHIYMLYMGIYCNTVLLSLFWVPYCSCSIQLCHRIDLFLVLEAISLFLENLGVSINKWSHKTLKQSLYILLLILPFLIKYSFYEAMCRGMSVYVYVSVCLCVKNGILYAFYENNWSELNWRQSGFSFGKNLDVIAIYV